VVLNKALACFERLNRAVTGGSYAKLRLLTLDAVEAGSAIRAVLNLDADTAAILLPALQTIISEQLMALEIAPAR